MIFLMILKFFTIQVQSGNKLKYCHYRDSSSKKSDQLFFLINISLQWFFLYLDFPFKSLTYEDFHGSSNYHVIDIWLLKMRGHRGTGISLNTGMGGPWALLSIWHQHMRLLYQISTNRWCREAFSLWFNLVQLHTVIVLIKVSKIYCKWAQNVLLSEWIFIKCFVTFRILYIATPWERIVMISNNLSALI